MWVCVLALPRPGLPEGPKARVQPKFPSGILSCLSGSRGRLESQLPGPRFGDGMSTTEKTLDERLQEYVKASVEAPPGAPVRDPVNRPMIHHWCDAIGDTNPIYVDDDLAAQSVHGGLVAPPTMLQAWGMVGLKGRGPSLPEGARANEEGGGDPGPVGLLHEAGFTSVVATDCEQDYKRYLRPGDVLRTSSGLESISGEKNTALGRGHFVTNKTTYWDQNDEIVGEMLFRILWFKPHSPGGE